jgi:hypothetical protein
MDGRSNLKEKLLNPVDDDFHIPRAWQNRSDLVGISWQLKGDYKKARKQATAPQTEGSYVRLSAVPEEPVKEVKENFNFKKWILSSTSFFSCCLKTQPEPTPEPRGDEFSYPPY